MDTISKRLRSKVMSAVKGRGNKSTELAFLKILRANQITGWRRHLSILGKPDFCWPRSKVAVFIDGCLWHGCPHFDRFPKSNKPFWKNKIAYNKKHDQEVNKTLRRHGWHVFRIWECKIGKLSNIKRLTSYLSSQ